MRRPSFALALLPLLPAACVQVDPATGETIPRGDQRYHFDSVQQHAEDLKEGMRKYEVLMLLGSPAEMNDSGDVWIYLPERPAVLVPARALKLEFENERLVHHGYHPIVLGSRL